MGTRLMGKVERVGVQTATERLQVDFLAPSPLLTWRQLLAFSSGLWAPVSGVQAAGSTQWNEKDVWLHWTAHCGPRTLHEDVNLQMQQDGKTGQVRELTHTSASVTGFGQWYRSKSNLQEGRAGLWWGKATAKALDLCKLVAP